MRWCFAYWHFLHILTVSYPEPGDAMHPNPDNARLTFSVLTECGRVWIITIAAQEPGVTWFAMFRRFGRPV